MLQKCCFCLGWGYMELFVYCLIWGVYSGSMYNVSFVYEYPLKDAPKRVNMYWLIC